MLENLELEKVGFKMNLNKTKVTAEEEKAV